PKHFVAFTLATGRHLGLLSPLGPGVAQRAPLGKAGLVFKQDQAVATSRRPDNRWPLVLKPGETLGRVEMVRHKACLLKRDPKVEQQRTDILRMVDHPKPPPHTHPEEDRGPTGRPTAPPLRATPQQPH